MKRYQLITCRWLGVVLCSLAGLVGRAQGPTLDPGFAATSLYRPAPVRQALRQPDGKTLLLGDIVQVQGQPAGQLTRLLAGTQQPDAAFNANVADLTGTVSRVLLLPDGRLLLTSLFGRNGAQGQIGVGGQSRAGLFMLQSDGLADAGYNANLPSGDYNVYDALVQPDGKVLLAGFFTSGPAPTITQLLRLNADGSPDTAFQSAIGSSITSGSTYCLALQPDGKLLVGGDFRGFNGMPRHSLVRLLPTGAVDVAFADPFINSGGVRVRALTLQADGGIVLASEPSPNSRRCYAPESKLRQEALASMSPAKAR